MNSLANGKGIIVYFDNLWDSLPLISKIGYYSVILVVVLIIIANIRREK